jgi:hypothetical protein
MTDEVDGETVARLVRLIAATRAGPEDPPSDRGFGPATNNGAPADAAAGGAAMGYKGLCREGQLFGRRVRAWSRRATSEAPRQVYQRLRVVAERARWTAHVITRYCIGTPPESGQR